MLILLKKATIIDPLSEYNGKTLDLLIEDGKIKEIKKNISSEKAEIVSGTKMCVSPGWVDLGTQICDPGFEHREDLESAAQAAAYGGFTTLIVEPNTFPVTQSKSEVLYLNSHSADLPVTFFATGALSKDTEGQNITEMADMHQAGAVAFSDGKKSVQNSGLMLRALQYVKAFDGIIINKPYDTDIARKGQMHEGLVSTSLGLPGIPVLAERLMAERDIALAEYSDSRLHIANVSSAETVKAIKNAKKKGIKITASVSAMNLAFDESALTGFDSNYKVLPPLRAKSDRKALIKGLKNGTIDFISSGHTPWENEHKGIEFPYADFGAINLQTAYSLVRTHVPNLSEEELSRYFSSNPRKIFGLDSASIQVGQTADLTLYEPEEKFTFTKENNQSKSHNSPLFNVELKGRIKGIINKNQVILQN